MHYECNAAPLFAHLARWCNKKGNARVVLSPKPRPGTSYQLQSVAAAGSTPKITAGVTWEEITIV